MCGIVTGAQAGLGAYGSPQCARFAVPGGGGAVETTPMDTFVCSAELMQNGCGGGVSPLLPGALHGGIPGQGSGNPLLDQIRRLSSPAGDPARGGGINSALARDEELTGFLVQTGQIDQEQGLKDYEELGQVATKAADGDGQGALTQLDEANNNPVGFNEALGEVASRCS